MRKITVATLVGLTLAAAGAAQAQSATYSIDPTHTFVTFEIDHMGTTTNRGRFDKKDGSVKLDKAAKKGSVEITIDMTSISTGTSAFDKHLQSPDFFNAEKFPTAKFTADKFSFNGDKVSEIAGTLTLVGKTQPVTLKASKFNCYMNPMLKREACGGDFETIIDRSAYGIDFGLNWGFPKEVKLLVQVEAIKQ
ncbi:polyisoprenoid-binding protein [Hylemonella gracilis]|uniref:Polyisoprenoid-binding protein n=1 Tax=Hylemonella gracilis TaxID=80880 RepID=A0A4P6UF55_9BURK|nr:YceI family protein [Hylemonella gracilis]QBK03383.1 polyisoprenoid-binding protein [Hylemonella gracilis]QBK06281.1 polyisoprenoid-binding protein [Hylemonella gracilis]